MKIETIVVLVLTAIALAGVVWLELQSRRTARSVQPPAVANSEVAERSSKKRQGR